MSSRSLAALLVAGCITAAAGGAYVAVRQNAASQPAVAAPVAAAPAPATSPQPVSETEALVGRTPASSGPADRGPADRGPADPAPTVARRRPHRSPGGARSLNGPTRFGPARRRALNRFPKRERRPAVAPRPADRGRASSSIAAPRAGQPGDADRRAAGRRKLRPPRPRLSLCQSPSACRRRRRLLLSRSSKKSCCPPPPSSVCRWTRRCRASVRGSRIGWTRG